MPRNKNNDDVSRESVGEGLMEPGWSERDGVGSGRIRPARAPGPPRPPAAPPRVLITRLVLVYPTPRLPPARPRKMALRGPCVEPLCIADVTRKLRFLRKPNSCGAATENQGI